MSAPDLSIVIPAFNEAERLPHTLARVRAYLDARGRPYEIVLADDGSVDDTLARARQAGGPTLVVTRSERNRGKGHAVRQGMLLATGLRRLMTDADLSTPIEELPRLEQALEAGHDVAIGSRAVRGARVEVRQGGFREGAGRVFNQLVRLLALPGVHDTQCGFKLFSARAASAAFERARLDGFGFDVEALFLARRAGLRIAEVPVVWRNDVATRVSLLKGAAGFVDIARVRVNAWAGRYDRPR